LGSTWDASPSGGLRSALPPRKRTFAPGQRSAAKLLSKDEARRIAVNIAELPELYLRPLLPTFSSLAGFEVP
jgi:hypothetical protein